MFNHWLRLKDLTMKKIIHFIGIDVSKETLDIALVKNNDKSNIYSSKVTNNKTGFKKMKQWLKVPYTHSTTNIYKREKKSWYK